MFDKKYWEERYRGHAHAHERQPSPWLVAEAGTAAGTALDAGCGEGANAIWLAERGWQVTAVDIATAALARAREHAAHVDIDWLAADLTTWTPPEEHFDLVTAHYVHPATSHTDLFRRLAAAVAPGGALLVVGHHPSGSEPADAHVTAEELAMELDPTRWEAVAETRTRTAGGVTLRDAVLRARRRELARHVSAAEGGQATRE